MDALGFGIEPWTHELGDGWSYGSVYVVQGIPAAVELVNTDCGIHRVYFREGYEASGFLGCVSNVEIASLNDAPDDVLKILS